MALKKEAVDIEFAGETLRLLAQKAVVWPREKTLFIADVHLGKAASFRAAGLAVPSGHSHDDIARIDALLRAYDIAHLIVLGDLVHNRASYTESLHQTMRSFAKTHPTLKRTLVMGNHDDHAGEPPIDWGFEIIHDDLKISPFVAAHAPTYRVKPQSRMSDAPEVARLVGHLHPAVSLQTAKESINLPCFWRTSNELVLPSFGLLTGRYTVKPEAEDVTFVVTGQQIFRVPSRAA